MAIGIAARLVHLDADPEYYEWIGYLTDEGRWVSHARDFALYGHLTYDWPLHLHLAPLFQAAHYVVFTLFGVTIWSARILTACVASMLLVGVWWFLRRHVTVEALLVGMALLAVEADLLALSRVATPEMMVMALEFGVFAILVSRATVGRAALAGIALLVTVGVKATALPMLLVFALVCVVTHGEPWRRRMARLGAFVGALAAPVVLVGLVVLLRSSNAVKVLSSSVTTVQDLLLVSAAYETMSFFFESRLSPLFALWGLALWIALLGWVASNTDRTGESEQERHTRRVFTAALVWIVAYAALMLGLDYFPNRYKIHVLIPMAIAITVGLSRLQRTGVAATDDALRRREGKRGWSITVALALPLAVMVASLVMTVFLLAGVTTGAIRVRVAVIAAAVVLIALPLHRWRHVRGLATAVALWPVLTMAVWTYARRVGVPSFSLWPPRDVGGGHLAWWAGVLLVTAVLAAILTMIGRRARRPLIGHALTAAAAGYVLLAALRLGPAFAAPTYTIRETSRDLGVVLAGMPEVATGRAEGLFNENRVRYQSLRRAAGDRPEAWVTVLRTQRNTALMQRADYCLLKVYPLAVSREYRLDPPGEPLEARVWVPRETGRCAAAP